MQAVPGSLPLVAIACAALVLATGCSPVPDKSGRFSSALGKAVRSPSSDAVDLSRIDAPAWDELFVFAARSTREDNCRVMHLGWLECRTTLPAVVADGEDFLVFRVKGRIGRAERHALSNGDFASGSVAMPQPILRSAAKFRIAPMPGGAADATRPLRLEYQG